MHLLAISLLAILAGTLLLAKFRKEQLSRLFSLIAWFFIVVGFILFIGFVAGAVCKASCCGYYGQGKCDTEMSMKDCKHDMSKEACCSKGMYKHECIKEAGYMHHGMMRESQTELTEGDSLMPEEMQE